MTNEKAVAEKLFLAASKSSEKTVFNIVRYGNVMASRGSVIPLFVDQVRAGKPITITNPDMTRFMMTLDDAVDLDGKAERGGRPALDLLVGGRHELEERVAIAEVDGGYVIAYRVVQVDSEHRRIATARLDENLDPIEAGSSLRSAVASTASG